MIDDETARENLTLKTKSIEMSYQIIDGILHVDSLEVLSELVDSLRKMSDEELFEWEKTNNFYSLYHAIYDAEEDIFVDSLLFESKLEKYKDLVYLNEAGFVEPQVISNFYQLVCNNEGYFYVGEFRHQVTSTEIIAQDMKRRSIEKRNYIVTNSQQTRAEARPRFPLASASYTGNKRRVNVVAVYYRDMARHPTRGWEGQQKLMIESVAGKKVLGSYKKYKTLHLFDVLAFFCHRGAYKKSDGTYDYRVVRYEGLGGGGSVGEERSFTRDYPLSPDNLWIPEAYIQVRESDIHILQVRAKTRGTGDSGAVINYLGGNSWVSFPFNIPRTGAPTILRPLVTENF